MRRDEPNRTWKSSGGNADTGKHIGKIYGALMGKRQLDHIMFGGTLGRCFRAEVSSRQEPHALAINREMRL